MLGIDDVEGYANDKCSEKPCIYKVNIYGYLWNSTDYIHDLGNDEH